jgi:hypothetical protein
MNRSTAAAEDEAEAGASSVQNSLVGVADERW